MSGTRVGVLALSFALLFSPARGHAAESSSGPLAREITLDAALALLRDQSPRSRAQQARVDVAASERVGARAWPNPSLSYSGTALASGTNTGAAWQHQFVLEQPLLLFGQIGAREQLADRGLELERARAAAELEERGLALRQGFVALLADQERVRLLEQSQARIERLAQIVRGRKAAGDRSVYDVTRLELEASTLGTQLQSAEADLQSASGQLAALLGFPGWLPQAQGDLEPRALPENLDQLWAIAQKQRPAIALARAAQAATSAGVTVARRERLPVPAVALGTLLTRDVNSTSLIFGLSLPLPIFDRGQGPMARATASREAEARGVEAELAESHAELERAQGSYLRERALVQDIERQQVAKLAELEKMAEQSYQGGGSGILDLLDVFRSVQTIRSSYLERREALKLAEESLIAAAGLEPLAQRP